MINLSYDMHLHSCLSPCADDGMTPANIIGMASIIGLDVVALTDHNSCKNCEAFLAAAEQFHLLAIPGMELCTSEEVHVLCYFPTLSDAMEFDAYVSKHMSAAQNQPALFGNQLIYNKEDELCGTESCLLIESSNISFFDLETILPKFHGIYGPAHLDRTSNSLISNLGFVPTDCSFHFAEFHNKLKSTAIVEANPHLASCQIIYNSDAHNLESLNEPINRMSVPEKSVEAVFHALKEGPPKIFTDNYYYKYRENNSPGKYKK